MKSKGWTLRSCMISVALGASAAACAFHENRPAVTARQELLGVRVYLDPKVAFSWTDDDCSKHADAYEQAIVAAARMELSRVGFVVISDPNAPRASVARATASATYCGSNGVDGFVEVSLEPGASAQARWNGTPDYGVATAVSQLAAAPQVLALGQDRTSAPATTTVASAAPPTPAPASASAPAPAAPNDVSGAPQPNAYAVVIGIEKYTGMPAPVGADTDARGFAELAKRSLGVPADHVKLALDAAATKGSIEALVAWARDSVPPGGRIYFYFSGHGAPDAQAGTAYLVPSDGDPKFLTQTAIPESDVLAELAKGKAKEVLAFLDSCFSGAGGRSVLPPGARPLVRMKDTPVEGQVAVFTASSGAEISGPASDGSEGLFTKYVVQGLGTGAADIDGDGQITLQELRDWAAPRVAREAKRDNRDQDPALTISSALGAPSSFVVEWGLPQK